MLLLLVKIKVCQGQKEQMKMEKLQAAGGKLAGGK